MTLEKLREIRDEISRRFGPQTPAEKMLARATLIECHPSRCESLRVAVGASDPPSWVPRPRVVAEPRCKENMLFLYEGQELLGLFILEEED